MALGDDKIADFTVDSYAALSLNIRRGKLALFRTPQISIVFQPRSFSSTKHSCPSMTSHVFRCLMDSSQPKENVILEIDFGKFLKSTLKFISTHTWRTVSQVFFFLR